MPRRRSSTPSNSCTSLVYSLKSSRKAFNPCDIDANDGERSASACRQMVHPDAVSFPWVLYPRLPRFFKILFSTGAARYVSRPCNFRCADSSTSKDGRRRCKDNVVMSANPLRTPSRTSSLRVRPLGLMVAQPFANKRLKTVTFRLVYASFSCPVHGCWFPPRFCRPVFGSVSRRGQKSGGIDCKYLLRGHSYETVPHLYSRVVRGERWRAPAKLRYGMYNRETSWA